MSATSGTGLAFTMAGSASAASAPGTASRTRSAPAAASARSGASGAAASAVSVVVIDWTDTGAPPPMATPPTFTCLVGRRAPSPEASPCPYAPMCASRRPGS
jgi:hypothetical protein